MFFNPWLMMVPFVATYQAAFMFQYNVITFQKILKETQKKS